MNDVYLGGVLSWYNFWMLQSKALLWVLVSFYVAPVVYSFLYGLRDLMSDIFLQQY